MYEILKDFQAFTAAIIALCAAGIAFCSAQRVARIQTETTRELAKRQAADSVAKEKEMMARKRAAFIIRTLHMIESLLRSVKSLQVALETLRGDQEQAPENLMAMFWTALSRQKPIRDEIMIFDGALEDISVLSPEDQYAIHALGTTIADCSDAVEFLKTQAGEDYRKVPNVALLSVMGPLRRAERTATELKEQFEKSLAIDVKAGIPGATAQAERR